MSKTLQVDSYKIVGLENHHVFVERDKGIQQVTINDEIHQVKFEKALTLDSAIENRIGFSDKVAIESIEKSGSYGYATKINMTVGFWQP